MLTVLHVLSLVIVIFGITMVFPLVFSFWYHDAAVYVFDEAVIATVLSGGALWFATGRFKRELQVRDGFLLVVLAWSLLPAFGTLPLLLYLDGLSFTDAYFEAVSGLTTTGATVLSDLDKLPPSLNMWRGEMVWLGGMGLIVLAVAILPLLGVGGRQMLKAETPGPMKESKLTPRIAETAKGLWYVYAVISAACLVAFRLAGMDWLDAWVHMFSTMGLGGFSSHDASFGYWDSPAIETVAILFMLVAGMNFGTHFLAWRQRGIAPYRHDPEAGWFLIATLGSVLLVAGYLVATKTYPDLGTALRYAAFNTVSIATTTGFANTDYNL
ncbi:MAG TPA: potassium transporter TrkG, partial [Burkholderiales bacterium]